MIALGLFLVFLAAVSNMFWCWVHVATGQGLETFYLPAVMTSYEALDVSFQEVLIYQIIYLIAHGIAWVIVISDHVQLWFLQKSLSVKYGDGRSLADHKEFPRTREQIRKARRELQEKGRPSVWGEIFKGSHMGLIPVGFSLCMLSIFYNFPSVRDAYNLYFYGITENVVITSVAVRSDYSCPDNMSAFFCNLGLLPKSNIRSESYAVTSDKVSTAIKQRPGSYETGDALRLRYLPNNNRTAYVVGSWTYNPNISATLGIAVFSLGLFVLLLGLWYRRKYLLALK